MNSKIINIFSVLQLKGRERTWKRILCLKKYACENVENCDLRLVVITCDNILTVPTHVNLGILCSTATFEFEANILCCLFSPGIGQFQQPGVHNTKLNKRCLSLVYSLDMKLNASISVCLLLPLVYYELGYVCCNWKPSFLHPAELLMYSLLPER
jgi:hypothetical protein